jgi:methionyl-tRNA formyltransferase
MGSPDFALPTLRALSGGYDVVGVVTQPDRPAGRGKQLTPPPVKTLAQELGLPVIQPNRLRGPEVMSQLRDWALDLIVVAAFGQILRQEVLELPPHGCINVHASLLPRWRGASPIQAAILAGDAETGVTIMCMDKGLDTGPILSKRATPIAADDTAATLSDRLADLGADLLIDTLPKYLAGELKPAAQPESGVTTTALLTKAEGLLETSQIADVLVRKVRAFNPWPGAYIMWKNQPLKIHRAHVASDFSAPGKLSIHNGLPAIGTAFKLLVVDELQPAGKKSMSGVEFLRGTRQWSD